MKKTIKKLIIVAIILSTSVVSLGFNPLDEKPPPVPQSNTIAI